MAASQAKNVLTERKRVQFGPAGQVARMTKRPCVDRLAAQRYAKNMPIQGTPADILKRALRLLHDDLRGTVGNARKHRP